MIAELVNNTERIKTSTFLDWLAFTILKSSKPKRHFSSAAEEGIAAHHCSMYAAR